MKELQLSKGWTTIVDDEDYGRVSGLRWHATRSRSGAFYAKGGRFAGGRLFLHKFILGNPPSIVDHKNGNTLDNRKENLRPASRKQNGANVGKRRATSSCFKGVSWEPGRGKWRAAAKLKGVHTNLGRFEDEISAAVAYDHAAKKEWGEFAQLNFGPS